jgi:hypothetical protein
VGQFHLHSLFVDWNHRFKERQSFDTTAAAVGDGGAGNL